MLFHRSCFSRKQNPKQKSDGKHRRVWQPSKQHISPSPCFNLLSNVFDFRLFWPFIYKNMSIYFKSHSFLVLCHFISEIDYTPLCAQHVCRDIYIYIYVCMDGIGWRFVYTIDFSMRATYGCNEKSVLASKLIGKNTFSCRKEKSQPLKLEQERNC